MKDKKSFGCEVLIVLVLIFVIVGFLPVKSRNSDQTYSGGNLVLDGLETDYTITLNSEAQANLASDEYFLIGTRNGEFIWGALESDPLAPRYRSVGTMVAGDWTIYEGDPKIHLTGDPDFSVVVQLSDDQKSQNVLAALTVGVIISVTLLLCYILIVDLPK